MGPTATAAVLSLTLLCAGVLQGTTGFGYVMLAEPILLAFLPVRLAVVTAVTVAMAVVACVVWTARRAVDLRTAVLVLLATAASNPLGALLLVRIPERPMKLAIGALLAAAALWMLWRERRPAPESTWSGPWPALATGALSGVLNTAVGLGGAAYVLYLVHRRLSKETHWATLMFLNLVGSMMSTVSFAISGLLPQVLRLPGLAVALPLSVAGMVAGMAVFRRVPSAPFRRLVLVAVAVLALGDALAAWLPR